MAKKCPPNTLCFDSSSLIVLFLFIILFIYFFSIKKKYKHQNKNQNQNQNQNIPIKKEEKIIIINNEEKNKLLEEPGQYYPGFRGVPINIRTRGEPDDYQQIGILTSNNDVKPLFGRRIYKGANLWNYYSALDSHLATKIPIKKTNKNCIEEQGCSEISNGDSVEISGSNQTYNVELYPNNEFRYIPY